MSRHRKSNSKHQCFHPLNINLHEGIVKYNEHSCLKREIGETGVSRDTFYFFSNIAENIYDRDFDLTLQGRGILPLQTGLISYVVTSFVATGYGVNDKWSNCPNLPRHGVGWDSTLGT